MATSSFNKDFTLNSKKAVESFEKIISAPSKSIKIKKDLVSDENEKKIEEKLKKCLKFDK